MEKNFDDLRYAELILKHLRNTANAEEEQELLTWLETDSRHQQLYDRIQQQQVVKAAISFQEDLDLMADWESVKSRAAVKSNKIGYRRPLTIGIAAATLLGVATVGYKWINKNEAPGQLAIKNSAPAITILPGSNKATLQLGNGEEVQLGNQPAVIKEEDGTNINQLANGLSYTKGTPGSNEIIYNTLTTPRGGQYQITLEDGTKVWLNAASSLKFPVHFSTKDRIVELIGEGYFEVAKEVTKPFKVKTGGMEVQVLGTDFNVAAYTNEVKTALVNGAVRVAMNQQSWQLKPGQEAKVRDNHVEINKADIEKITAWKEGLFFFRNDNFKEIMDQVSRWYDVNVVYEGNTPSKGISGNISRQASLAQVLEMLSFVSGAHFKVNGRIISVM
ncbi:FecR family protein [Chitinophaga silvatica]|uniref:FecR family protein n=1 Tax=Chitinophaga silvatica TaxID=2282649 RepID=A0A3E1Y3V7_9BACT|nr:FecR family protein [Chitinophaga silvatica]RFS19312.1 FecR family protein [Chitinophaga silvatica]